MIQVPAELKSEIQKLRGRRLTARARIDYSDIFIDSTIQGTASSVAPNTFIDQVYNGREDMTEKWASLDGSWVLGVYALGPETEPEKSRLEIGWWGTELSNLNRQFIQTEMLLYGEGQLYGEKVMGGQTTEPELVLTFTPRTISTIRISFDNKRMEYAEDFEIKLYNFAGSVLSTETFTGNTGIKTERELSEPINLVARLEVKITKWSHAWRQVKVAEFFTAISQEYGADDIISLRINEEREIDDDSLPVGTTASAQCVLTFYNRDRVFDYDNTTSPLFNFIREGVRITPEIGDGVNWVPLGTFYARAWDVDRRSLTVTVTGLNFVSNLGETEYKTSRIIQAPADQDYSVSTSGEWNAGTVVNLTTVNNEIRLE